MAKLPQVRRLVLEDFPTQKSWVGKLFLPLNLFMEGVFQALNRNLTVRQNLAADIVTVTLTAVPSPSAPAGVPWSLKLAPICVLCGNVVRQDGATFTLSGAAQVQWSYGSSGLQLTGLTGVTPDSADVFVLTLVILTG